MRALAHWALIVALVLVPPAHAAERIGLSFSSLSHEGTANLEGTLTGLRIRDAPAQATFEGTAASLRLQTVNTTARAVAFGTVDPQSGGMDDTYSNVALQSVEVRNYLDIVIIPLASSQAPHIQLNGTGLNLGKAIGVLQESGYVDSRRPLLAWAQDAALTAGIREATDITISGDFAMSIWAWDFEAAGQAVPTGSHRNNPTEVPVVGTEVTAETMEQVAQLTIFGGYLKLSQLGSQVQVYGNDWTAILDGQTVLNDVTGKVPTTNGHRVDGATVELVGTSSMDIARTDEAYLRILHAEHATLDGKTVQILDQQPGPRPGTTISAPTGSRNPWLGAAGAIVGIMLVAGLVHGPMQGYRFNRVQMRFEERDYIEVLARIDPFTRRRRFRRRASFLKAVSLLSLESYQEASLYIDTLDSQGPDPATRSFLKACAAAGLGQDSIAIEHLGTCLSLDPTYREEAATVPLLATLLPYFDLAGGGTTT